MANTLNLPSVSIVYVNWNCSSDILQSLESVRQKVLGVSYEVIVVDNDSQNDDLSALEAAPEVRLIRHKANNGFGAGCNVGANAARGEFLFFLNPDTILINDVPTILSNFLLAHPQVSACGPTVLNEDGTIDFGGGRRDQSIVNEILEHSTLCFRFPKVPFIGRPYYGDWDHCSTRQVDCLVGAAMMFRKNAFQRIGGFDENFFLYCEEMDLCLRTRKSQGPIFYVHLGEVLHKCRRSTIKLYGSFTKILKQCLVSREYLFGKHHGPFYVAGWRFSLGFIYFLKYLRSRQQEDLDICRWGFYLANKP